MPLSQAEARRLGRGKGPQATAAREFARTELWKAKVQEVLSQVRPPRDLREGG